LEEEYRAILTFNRYYSALLLLCSKFISAPHNTTSTSRPGTTWRFGSRSECRTTWFPSTARDAPARLEVTPVLPVAAFSRLRRRTALRKKPSAGVAANRLTALPEDVDISNIE